MHDYALFTHRHRKGGQRRSSPCNLDTGHSRVPSPFSPEHSSPSSSSTNSPHLIYPTTRDPQVAAALRIIDALPPDASVVSEDHRWLAHLANRSHLSVLSPQADYILTNGSAMKPLTNYTEKDRAVALEQIRASGDYERFECEGGFVVYAKKSPVESDRAKLVCAQASG